MKFKQDLLKNNRLNNIDIKQSSNNQLLNQKIYRLCDIDYKNIITNILPNNCAKCFTTTNIQQNDSKNKKFVQKINQTVQ